jgi:integrase
MDEVRKLLAAVRDAGGHPVRLIVRMLYGCGMRVSEPLNLRLKDVLLDAGQIIIRAAKGGKDRVVPMPCELTREITAQVAVARAVAARDALAGIPVALPGLLAQKYPHWQFSPKWAFLFPGARPCAHPRHGHTVRWHLLEVNVQRAVARAARPLGLDITPHHLRHAYATHCLNAGQNPRAIQRAMGHAQLETTMGYLHAEAMGVSSPLAALEAMA